MWGVMVDDVRHGQHTIAFAVDAQWVLLQKHRPLLVPIPGIEARA